MMPYNGFIHDLDGTAYLCSCIQVPIEPAPGCGSGGASIDPPAAYAGKLSELGIPCDQEDVVTSVFVTVDHVAQAFPGARFHLIGDAYLRDRLIEAGLREAPSPDETDLVIVSLDRHLDYRNLLHGYLAAQRGAPALATNIDLVCPSDGEDILDAGTWIAPLEALVRGKIDAVLGKPSPAMAEVARGRTGSSAAETLVAGDRIETDVALGAAAGMATALVLSGVTDRSWLAASRLEPDFAVETLADLPAALEDA